MHPRKACHHHLATPSAAANDAVVCHRRRTVCPLIFRQLVVSPSIAARMKLCTACRCRHCVRREIYAQAQGLPHTPGDWRSCRKRCLNVLRRRTVCILIFKKLAGRQAPVSRLA